MTTIADRVTAELGAAMTHQIVLVNRDGDLALSCTCRHEVLPSGGRGRYRVIALRVRWTVPEVLAAWRAWHEARGIEVAP